MRHCRAPGVQNRGDAKARAQMLRISRDCDCGLGRCLEQDVVDDGLVLIRDIGDRAGQRVDDVEVWRREQLCFPLFEPLSGRRALAFWAVPIAAAVVGDDRVGAIFAARNMTAERRGAAALDCTHHLQLAEAYMAGVGATPRRPVVAEDFRDLQSWTGHSRGPLKPAAVPWLSSWASCAARTASPVGSRWQRSCRWPPACSAPSCRAFRDRGAPE